MSSFGLIASESARHSNKKIKGKRIRDDLMFNKGEEEASRSLNTYRQVFKILDGMENDWTHDQKLVKKEKLRAEMEKGKRTGEFLGMVLRKCKLHDGPLTSINELEEFLKRENGDKKKLLRVEIQFQRLTNSRDFQERPDLYKVNGLNGEEMITNLATLLASDAVANHGEDVMFNSEDQIM